MDVKKSVQENKVVGAQAQKKYKEIAGNIFRKYGILLIFIAMCIVMSMLSPAFLKVRNLTIVVRQISIIAVVAMGVTMVIITGGIDLASGSVIALVSVMTAKFAHPNTYPVFVPVFVGLAIGALTGFISGTIVAKGKIPPFIATLGMMTAARGAALLISDGKPIGDFSKEFEYIGGGHFIGIPVPILILIGVIIISHILLSSTKFGKYIYAIGGNENAAVVSGVNVDKYKILLFTYAGLLSALAGIIMTSRISSGQPGAGQGFELDAIASAVIGGTSLNGGIGTIPGTIIGALIIGVLNNGFDLLGINPYWQPIVKGAIIVGAVLIDERKNRSK